MLNTFKQTATYSSARKVSKHPAIFACLLTTFLLHTIISRYRKQLKPHQRSKIIDKYKAKVPLRQILRNTGLRLSTVHWTINQSDLCDKAQHDLPYSSRPRHSTRAQDNRLYRCLRINNDLRWSDIEDLMPIKRTQIRQRMREINLKFY